MIISILRIFFTWLLGPHKLNQPIISTAPELPPVSTVVVRSGTVLFATVMGAFKEVFPDAKESYIDGIQKAQAVFIKNGINTPLRYAHFFAQTGEESDHYKTYVEYGDENYFSRYDNRIDLGNTEDGDGYKYRGRGAIMLTGKYNYKVYGKLVGEDLVSNPDHVSDPLIGIIMAVVYWTNNGLNELADEDDIEKITRKINGGLNGIDERQDLLDKFKDKLKVPN